MSKKPAQDMESFLKHQDSTTLVNVLTELAAEHPNVRNRLVRLSLADRTDELAAEFRKLLTRWRRSKKKFFTRSGAREFGQELQDWLDQVEAALLDKNPRAALALFESFIELDATWFEMADDSDGSIGYAVMAACVYWLQAAKRCGSPSDKWPDRIEILYLADRYGARDELLRRADLLFDETGLRQLVNRFEGLQTGAQAFNPKVPRWQYENYKMSAAIKLLSKAASSH